MDVSRIIHADASRVWDLTTDTWSWPLWGPTVRKAILPAGLRYISPGTRGRVQTAVGIWLPFVITDFEPGAYWAWQVGGVQATGHRVDPLGPARCQLTFEIPNWALPYWLVCRLALRNIARMASVSAD